MRPVVLQDPAVAPERRAGSPDVSVIVPVAERPGPLDGLYREASRALDDAGLRAEFVFLIEPAFRPLAGPLEAAQARGAPIRVVRMGHAVGESALLKVGAEQARAPIVLTLPAYRRVVPEALADVVEQLREGEADMVVARRWPRHDSWLNRLQNRVYHALLRPLGEERLNDVACGVRAMPRELLLELPLYGDFHRFLPFVAAREGYTVSEIDAVQHPADRQARVYSPGTYVKRLIDLVGIFFLLRFTERPLRFFGLVGTLAAGAGALVLAVIGLERFQGVAVADRPMLLIGVLLVVLGVQAIALGLVGEIIVHLSAPARRPYRLRADPARSASDRE